MMAVLLALCVGTGVLNALCECSQAVVVPCTWRQVGGRLCMSFTYVPNVTKCLWMWYSYDRKAARRRAVTPVLPGIARTLN